MSYRFNSVVQYPIYEKLKCDRNALILCFSYSSLGSSSTLFVLYFLESSSICFALVSISELFKLAWPTVWKIEFLRLSIFALDPECAKAFVVSLDVAGAIATALLLILLGTFVLCSILNFWQSNSDWWNTFLFSFQFSSKLKVEVTFTGDLLNIFSVSFFFLASSACENCCTLAYICYLSKSFFFFSI